MTKINKIYTDDPTNFQGYELNENNQVKMDSFMLNEAEFKRQTDGTIVIKDNLTGLTTTILDINRDSEQAITKVFGSQVDEDSTTAFQPIDTDSVTATVYNSGREQYQMDFDFLADSDRHTLQYRSKSTTGLENVRVLIFKLVNTDPQDSLYNELIAGQWWMTKSHIWSTRKKSEVIEERVRKQDTDYISPYDLVPDANGYVSIDVDVTFEKDCYYRILVCADNQFDLKGIDNVITDPVNGGTQFFLYTERTYKPITKINSQSLTVVFDSTDIVDFTRDNTNTSVLVDNGDSFAVNSIKAVVDTNGTILIQSIKGDKAKYKNINHANVTINGEPVGVLIDDVVNELNALFTVTVTGYTPLQANAEITIDGGTAGTFDYGSDLIISGGAFIDQTTNADNQSWVVGVETIDAEGEFITFAFQGDNPASGDSMQWGLIDTSTDLYINRDANGIPWNSNVAMKYSGSSGGLFAYDYPNVRITPQTTWTSSDEYTTLGNGGSVLVRVGLNAQRYGIWSFYDASEGVWIDMHRTSSPLPYGEYAMYYNPRYASVVKLQESGLGNLNVYEQDLNNAPRTYYAIASPSNNWHYPIFQTSTEAEQYDAANGGSGQFTQEVFPNDAVAGRIWYAPVTNYTIDSPTLSTERTWNIAATLDDSVFSPPAFQNVSYTFDELSGFSVVIEQGTNTSYTTEVIPDGASFGTYSNNSFSGQTPEVLDNNVTNPTDTYTFTVRRTPTNGFPPSEGTLTIVVNNLTAPATAISGFTWDATSTALVDSNTMDDGSIVTFTNKVEAAKRFIIPTTWVETYVLPALSVADDGDKIYLGVKDGAGSLTDGIVDTDWDAYISWEKSGSSHISTIYADGYPKDSVTVHSLSSSTYAYAFEADDHGDLYVIACNFNDLNTEVGVDYGGQFGRVVETTGTAPFTLSLVTEGLQMDFAEGSIVEIVIPKASNWIQIEHDVSHSFIIDGTLNAMPTLQAGYTYRFLMADVVWADQSTSTGLAATDILKFTADGSTEYTTGIVRSGAVGSTFAYVEFTVPSDVPPLWWYNDKNGISQTNGVSISGSTYVVPVTGVTLEGPAANQTGSNLFDANDHGWLSIDEQLSAGERLVLDSNFLYDLVSAMPDDSDMRIGLKDTLWTDAYAAYFEGGTYLYIARYSSSDVRIQINSNGSSTSTFYTSIFGISGFEAFIEITSSGNNIRIGLKSSSNSSDNVNSTAYADWHSTYKLQTGDQGYGITSIDVMVMGSGNLAGNSAGMDSADVDWTGLSEISVPTPPVTNNTPWTKAVDFSGGAEYLSKVNSSYLYSPLNLGNASSTVAAPTAGQTVTSGHPWATAIVFQIDGNSSNQHIWNNGEGAGSTDDNIYLRVDANRNLYFGWGRDGALNECEVTYGSFCVSCEIRHLLF